MSRKTDFNSLTWKEGLVVVAMTWLNVGSLLLLVCLALITWDRQYQIVVLEKATVFDQWDAFGWPQPRPMGVVEAGSQLPVLFRFHSIEGGGIRAGLPDGRYGHLVPLESDGDFRMVRRLEPVSILIFITLTLVFGWEWVFVFAIRKRIWTALVVAIILLPEILSANLLVSWGKV
jgi:hypothetical protein